jgi:serine/threonine-protein kinase
VTEPQVIGRYALFDEIAAGGMATVHLGRLLGPEGFGRTVAIKRLHPHYVQDQEFATMFLDEARVAARIRHPNVVPIVDVVQSDGGMLLVMDYVHGESLSRLMRAARKQGRALPVRITTAIMYGALLGLHAAHETRAPTGEILGVVHRDVSPQNIIVGADGVPRVLDFGIAKAAGRAQVTREGQIKGKLAYMAPEQVRGQVDRRTDVFSASVCLWEALAGKRMHEGMKDVEIITRVMKGLFGPPSAVNPEVTPALDQIVLRGLSVDPDTRYATAREMALEIERNVGLATPSEVSECVERLASEVLQARNAMVHGIEIAAANLKPADDGIVPPPVPPEIPVELEPPPDGTPLSQLSQSTTGASIVVANVPPPSVMPPEVPAPVKMALGLSVMLGLIGGSLGIYAIAARSSVSGAARRAGAAAALSMTAREESPPPPNAPPVPTLSPATPDAATTSPPQKPIFRAPTPPPQRTDNSRCNPPYTVDEAGHRHYKPDCD